MVIGMLSSRKMAMVVPAGTEITRQGVSDAGKRGCVMVVKPVARAYILSGHMMSSCWSAVQGAIFSHELIDHWEHGHWMDLFFFIFFGVDLPGTRSSHAWSN